MTALALVHSPLTGSSVWFPVAEILKERGQRAAVPALVDSQAKGGPYWGQHAVFGAAAIDQALAGSACLLAGHSGAGPLLPAIQSKLTTSVAGRIYVDAGLPQAGLSRLEMMKSESPAWAERIERHLRKGGCFPEWNESDLQALIPDGGLRRQTVQELRPWGLDFFSEPIPAPDNGKPVPSGYLQFSAAYEAPAAQAEALGWPAIKFPAGHFHMLADPPEVAALLIEMLGPLSG